MSKRFLWTVVVLLGLVGLAWWVAGRSSGEALPEVRPMDLTITAAYEDVATVGAGTATRTPLPTFASAAPSATYPPPVRITATPTVYPVDCEAARALGMDERAAGRWAHLDGDGDGVACYGD